MSFRDYISQACDTVESAGASLYQEAVDDSKKVITEAGHLGKVFGQAGLHALIQEPVDGLEQLANHITKPLFHYELPKLHIIDSPKCNDTADRWANGLGEVTGFVGSFFIAGAGLSKGLSLVGKIGEVAGVAEHLPMAARILTTVGELGNGSREASLLLRAGRAATQAGLYKFLFTPEKEDGHYWRHKLLGTAGWAAGGGLGYLAGRGIVASMEKAGMPIDKSLFRLDRFRLINQLAEKGGIYSALSQAQIQVQHIAQLLGQNVSSNTIQNIASFADSKAHW